MKASNDEQEVGWGAITRVMDEVAPPRLGGFNGSRWFNFRVALGSVIYLAERYGIPLTQAMTIAARKFGEGTVRKALTLFPDDTSIAALKALDCLTNAELASDPINFPK